MDDEDLFSQDALCRSSQCSKCSENLDRTPDDPDEYNPLCTVCRQRLGEAVAFLVSEWRIQEAQSLLSSNRSVRRRKQAAFCVLSVTFLFVLGVVVGCISTVLFLFLLPRPP
jgi:hypothetical protein